MIAAVGGLRLLCLFLRLGLRFRLPCGSLGLRGGLRLPAAALAAAPAAAPGGFFVYGLIIAILNKVSHGRAVKRKSFDCESCPSFATCGGSKGACEK